MHFFSYRANGRRVDLILDFYLRLSVYWQTLQYTRYGMTACFHSIIEEKKRIIFTVTSVTNSITSIVMTRYWSNIRP